MDTGIRVLHVDDEPDYVDVTAQFLEWENERLDVLTETNAVAGFDRLREADVDCVVSDYNMPGMDGLEFLERVREADPDLPFILFTGRGSEEIAAEAISAGVTDYIQKGGEEQYTVLAKRIEQAVTRRRAERNYREIFEKATDGIALHDPDTGEIVDANERFCDMNGYTHEEIVGMSISEVSADDPEYTDERARGLIGRVKDEGPIVFEWCNRTKGGREYPVEVHLKQTTIGGKERVLAFVRDISDRKERERELTRFETIVETVADGVFVMDTDGCFRYVNSYVEQLTGYDREEIVGEHASLFLDEETIDRFEDAIVEMYAGERESAAFEIEATMADGRLVPTESRVAVLPPEAEVDGTVGVVRDISDRRARERKTERLQRVAADLIRAESRDEIATTAVAAIEDIFSLPLGGLGLVEDGGTRIEPVAVTETTREQFDDLPTFERDETDPDSVVWAVFEEGESAANRQLERCVHPAVEGIQSVIVHPLGDHGVLLLAGSEANAFDATDAALAEILASTVTAALDRVDREEVLRTERDRFAALFEMIPEPVVQVELVEEEAIIEAVNSAFEETFGYPADELEGQAVNDVIVPEGQLAEAEAIDEAASEGATLNRVVRRLTAEGPRDFLFRSVPIRNDDERTAEFGIYIDIHEQKERERQLARQNERLDEFASIVSHDLRNPLNLAAGHVELAREECDSDHLEHIAEAHDRMETLITDVLAWAREAKTVEGTEPVELAAAARECWPSVATSGAELVLETEQTIEADSTRLKRLLENLFRNAVQHGGSDVTVRVGPLEGEPGFFVADDGPGVPEREREQILESGYTTSDDGTGFGLSIVTEIAEAHGWEVRVAGSEDGGARFEIADVHAGLSPDIASTDL